MARLIDPSTFIDLERRGWPLGVIFASGPDEPFALASVTAAELLVGVERADSGERRRQRAAFVNDILDVIAVLPFDLDTARVHARVSARMASSGVRIGAHDLLIAATALAHGYEVLTLNVRDFGRVPGLVVRQPDR